MNNQEFDNNLILMKKKPQIHIWSRIKKELKKRGIKDKEKQLYKEKIGFKIIDDNKYLINEILTWAEFYNEYHPKMPLYYDHVKEFIPLFKKIIDLSDKIRIKVNMNKAHFAAILEEYIVSKTNNDDLRNILTILTYDFVQTQTEFKNYVFKEYQIVIDEDKNLDNIDYMKNALLLENEYFKREIEWLTSSMNKMSDMIASKSFLSKQRLISLANYLDKYYDEISSNIITFSKLWDGNDF